MPQLPQPLCDSNRVLGAIERTDKSLRFCDGEDQREGIESSRCIREAAGEAAARGASGRDERSYERCEEGNEGCAYERSGAVQGRKSRIKLYALGAGLPPGPFGSLRQQADLPAEPWLRSSSGALSRSPRGARLS